MTRQDLAEQGYGDVKCFEAPDYDGCIIEISTDRRAIYSLAMMVILVL